MATPVVFIHGLWLHASSWEPWVHLFRDAGYEPLAPGWPGDGETVEASRAGADAIGEVSIAARAHRNRPMHQLKPMAVEVLRVILNRAGVPTAGTPPHERPAIRSDRANS